MNQALSAVRAINNNGVIVGNVSAQAAGWQPSTQVLAEIPGFAAGSNSWAADVNDSGVVVGSYSDSNSGYQGFVRDASGNVTLLSAAGEAINNSGWFVANSFLTSRVYDPSGMNFSTLSSNYDVNSYDINDAMQITGEAGLGGSGLPDTAFIAQWDSVTSTANITSIGYLPGDNMSVGIGINESGWVVGMSQGGASGRTAFVWDGTSMYNLNQQLNNPIANIHLMQAAAINDSGQIAVTGMDSNGNRRGYLLTPTQASAPNGGTGAVGAVPEPGTWMMAIVGFGALGSVMRRRSSDNTAPALAA